MGGDENVIGTIAPEWSDSRSLEFTKKLNGGKPFTLLSWSQSLKKKTLQTFVPIFIGNSSLPWMYGTVVPQDETYASIVAVLRRSAIIIVIGFMCILFALWIMARGLLLPLSLTQDALREIAEGDGDLTRELAVQTRDETAELARSFNRFVEKLRFHKAGLSFEMIKASIDEVSGRKEEIRASVAEQTEGNKGVLENMETLRRIGTEVASGSAEMSAGSAIILSSVQQLSEVTAEVDQAMRHISDETTDMQTSALRMSEVSHRTTDGIIAVNGAVARFTF